MEIITVVIAEDHPSVRQGIKSLLGRSSDINVIGVAGNGREAVDLVGKLCPDILVLDINMPIMDGFQVLEELQKQKTKTRVIVLSGLMDKSLIADLYTLGAWGFYVKEDGPEVLVKAIHQAIKEREIKTKTGLISQAKLSEN